MNLMIAYILLGLFIAFVAVSFYLYTLKVFDPIHVNETVFPGGHLIYQEYVGNYRNLSEVFERVIHDLNKLYKAFQGSHSVGIYYDNPMAVAEKNKCRGLVGILIPEHHPYEKIAPEIDVGKFKYALLPKSKSVHLIWPFFNKLSFFFLALRGYTELSNYIKVKNLTSEDNTGPAVEVYHFQGPSKNIDVHFLWAGERKQYYLHTAPPPVSRRLLKTE